MKTFSTPTHNRSPALWDPFSAFVEMRRHLDVFMHGVLSQQCISGANWRPAIDVDEDEHSFTIHIEVPGWEKQDVAVEIGQHILTIRGQRGGDNTHEITAGRSAGQSAGGRRGGSFSQSLRLPPTIAAEHIRARFERGLLSVRLPKQRQAEPQRLAITSAPGSDRELVGG
ncbi:MAG: Hsp20/alpha crystallin family protein [Planctomycetes bacterium]|nr:Hsp20/alpha crystallin family protein [Planctomycetota bacterium]